MDTDTAELLKRIALGEDSVLKLKTVEFRGARVMGPHKDGIADEQGTERNAAFETVVNAVAHRDYSIYGSKIRLHLFSDRLELFSPGTIPNTMTIESISERQSARN